MGLARRSPAPRRLRLEVSAWTSLGVVAALLAVLAAVDAFSSSHHSEPSSRSLASVYPDDALIDRPYGEASNRWWIFLHIIGIGYMLLGLNTVCDVYFCAALEEMVERWNVKPDVAGATFMAAGGSAPELFTSLLGTLVTQNDVGFGTIVGSAIFNVLFVIGLCGWVAKEEIKLTWWPLFRDCSSYMIGLAFLAWVASDEVVRLWEALMLFMLYVLYCVLMYNNAKVEALVKSGFFSALLRKRQQTEPAESGSIALRFVSVKPSPKSEAGPHCSTLAGVKSAWGEKDNNSRYQRSGTANTSSCCASTEVGLVVLESASDSEIRVPVKQGQEEPQRFKDPEQTPELPEDSEKLDTLPAESAQEAPEGAQAQDGDGEEEDEAENLLAWPSGGLKDKILWCLCLPVYVPLYFVIPSSPKWFLVTFALSLLWIAFFSFFMVWWVEILGEVCHIDPIIMGYTLLAAGTSIPDAVSSVAVARLGQGDMSVSSSIGSNIFDILVGLPIPWTIKLVIDLIVGRTSQIRILSPYLTFFVLLLLFMVAAVVVIIHSIGWKLTRMLGFFMAVLYAIFLAAGITVELTAPEWLKF